jgi:hypothetical protein
MFIILFFFLLHQIRLYNIWNILKIFVLDFQTFSIMCKYAHNHYKKKESSLLIAEMKRKSNKAESREF